MTTLIFPLSITHFYIVIIKLFKINPSFPGNACTKSGLLQSSYSGWHRHCSNITKTTKYFKTENITMTKIVLGLSLSGMTNDSHLSYIVNIFTKHDLYRAISQGSPKNQEAHSSERSELFPTVFSCVSDYVFSSQIIPTLFVDTSVILPLLLMKSIHITYKRYLWSMVHCLFQYSQWR